jgi:hypothetical protein
MMSHPTGLQSQQIQGACEHDDEGIFRPKRDEVTGGWWKLCNDDVHNL